jgi:hypothetical protein
LPVIPFYYALISVTLDGWTAERLRFDLQQRQYLFGFPNNPDRLWDPPSLLFSKCWALYTLALKPPECKADHSSSSGAEVKNEWSYTSTSPYAFMTCKVLAVLSFASCSTPYTVCCLQQFLNKQ